MNEQGQNTPDLTNEEEIGSLPEKEFRILIVKMIQNLGNRIDKMQETFNKDIEELKRNQATMKKHNRSETHKSQIKQNIFRGKKGKYFSLLSSRTQRHAKKEKKKGQFEEFLLIELNVFAGQIFSFQN